MTTRIMIELAPDAAAEMRGAPRSAAGKPPDTPSLRDATSRIGLVLQPVHPGATHPLLAHHFMAEADTREAAEALVQKLRALPGVEAAYLGADPEPPED
jgi:hypothetical protein